MSPQRLNALNAEIDGPSRVPRPSQTRWNFESRTIKTVYEHRQDIINCCENLQKEDSNGKLIYSEYTVNGAITPIAITRTLTDTDNIFWLDLWYENMANVDILF